MPRGKKSPEIKFEAVKGEEMIPEQMNNLARPLARMIYNNLKRMPEEQVTKAPENSGLGSQP